MTDYRIIRSRRRTMALEVTRDALVVVRAPLHTSDAAVAAFVASHAQWLEGALARRIAHNAAHPEPTEAERKALIARAKAELPQRTAYWSTVMGLTGKRQNHLRAYALRLMQRQKQRLLFLVSDALPR